MRRESLILPTHKVLMLKARSLYLRATGQTEAIWHVEHQLRLNAMYVEMRRKAVITKRACPWIGEEPNTFVRPVLSSY
jgi:hypothetical protein